MSSVILARVAMKTGVLIFAHFENRFSAGTLTAGRVRNGLMLRKLDVLMPITRAWNEAAKKGCHGVDPDNVDGYSNSTGFALSYGDQLVLTQPC